MPKQAEMDAPGLRQGSCSNGDRRGEVAGRSVVGARGWSSLRRSLGAAGVAACLLAAIAASAQAAPVPSDFTLAGSNTREAAGGPLVTVDGTLRTWHGDTFTVPVGVGAGIDTGIAGLYRLADLDPGEAAALAGKRVHGIGELRGTVLSVRGGSIEATEEAASPAAVGVATVAVLLFNFTGDQRQPWTQSTVRSVVFDGAASVNAYYQNASYGKLSLAGDVFGWYTIAASNSGCDYRRATGHCLSHYFTKGFFFGCMDANISSSVVFSHNFRIILKWNESDIIFGCFILFASGSQT